MKHRCVNSNPQGERHVVSASPARWNFDIPPAKVSLFRRLVDELLEANRRVRKSLRHYLRT